MALKQLKFLFGLYSVLHLIPILIISIPVYIFRYFSILLAKWLRPDLEEIMDGQGSAFVNDYFYSKVPRSNIVITTVFQGSLSVDQLKLWVLDTWVNAKNYSLYKKFQLYPVRWMGFTFWKKEERFNIDNHIEVIGSNGDIVTESDLEILMENLLNSKWSPEQSPWKLYLIEDYQPTSETAQENNCAIITKWHHSLTDGVAMLNAMMCLVSEEYSNNKQLNLPTIKLRKTNFWQSLFYWIKFPVLSIFEMAHFLSAYFDNSPFKVPNPKKKWHHVYVKSSPISVQLIKNIKNHYGVSFTSVLISGVSAGITEYLNDNNEKSSEHRNIKSISCASVMPIVTSTRKPGLINFATLVVLELPTANFKSPEARLIQVHKMLEHKQHSTFPIFFNYLTSLLGCHFYPISWALLYNRLIPIGLTNVAGVPRQGAKANLKSVRCYAAAGALEGESGAAFTVFSHGDHVVIQACIEEAIMSKREAKALVDNAAAEICKLGVF